IKAKALDDRVGCALLLEILKRDWQHVQVSAVLSVQEEIGLRGARVAAFAVEPDVGIPLDGTVRGDIPGTATEVQGPRLGNAAAPSIKDRGSIPNRAMLDQLIKIAESEGIAYQFREATSGGNDAGAIQQAKAGCPVVSVSVPCRYIHTP